MELPSSFHIDVLNDCKLCNNCNFFKEEMTAFINSVPMIYHRLVVEFLVETFHCIIHCPHHMWFFILFKKNAQFVEAMHSACNRMNNSDVAKRVIEVIKHVIDDR